LNVKSEPSRFISNWKSRDKHCCSLDNAGKTLFAKLHKAQSIHCSFFYHK
jgi:hypothetical protein